jgi:hypothetical protein
MTLVHDDGKPVQIGDKVVTFRDEEATVISITPPHRQGSTGRVQTELGYHYPGVYGLRWV